MSKTGEVLTVSTDGTTAIWDVKKMDKPIEGDVVQLQPKNNDGGCKGILGGLCLDYDPLVGGPSKYMVGTEQGTTLSCNRYRWHGVVLCPVAVRGHVPPSHET